MKKRLFSILFSLFVISLYAQNNVTVNINNPIYEVIDNAQLRGLCNTVSSAKPFTEKKIVTILNEILDNKDKLSDVEIQIIQDFIDETKRNASEQMPFGSSYFENNSFSVPVAFGIYYDFAADSSLGLYNKSKYNSFAFDLMPEFSVTGDVGDFLGFNFSGLFNLAKVPLIQTGNDYYIGTNWFDYIDSNGNKAPRGTKNRTINTFENNAWLPYTHIYNSAGQFYWITKIIPSSLGEWTNDLTAYANFYTEIHGNFLNDRLNIGFGRMVREWAAMDKNGSLVLNRTAVPFYGIDFSFDVTDWLKYSFLAGNVENPNRPDIFGDSYYPDDAGNEDAYYFQNSFSLQMLEMNFGGFHLDFGSTVVYPKRFELGYLFPLTVLVEYQNHVGDFDNVAMFGDIKYTKTGLGSIWASLFTDEINDFKTNPFTGTREMYAIQGGIQALIPAVSFGQLTLRYTKVEPYCYTHHSIDYVPYYNHYICENYTNAGLCLGSYLPPNTDEILLRFDSMPFSNIQLSFAYQLTRHGAEYGSQQVRGSSLYSELDNHDRDYFYKYFLHDGAYNWIHAISANCSFISKKTKLPFKLDFTLGLVISYYTGIDQSVYNDKDSFGNSNVNFNTKYSTLDTDEYPFKIGPIISIGCTIGKF